MYLDEIVQKSIFYTQSCVKNNSSETVNVDGLLRVSTIAWF
jgi:hypothetical protein